MSYTLIDTHCHIASESLYERIDEVMANAKANNVDEFLVVCTHFESFKRAKEIQKKYANIKIAFGFHPSDLYDFNEEDYLKLEEIVKNKEIVCLGEIGLDYHWDTVTKADQKVGFIRQIEIANKYNMPIIPCVINYRPRTGIYRLFGSQNEPLIHVTIGEPIFPNTQLPRGSEVERLRQTTHQTMCHMAGITHNTWHANM